MAEELMRTEAQDSLRASERTLQLFVEFAPAAIAMFDCEMRYVAVSKRYFADYKLEERNLIGVSHYDVFPEMPQRWREIHQRCLAGATESAEEDVFPRADGSVDWVRWEIHPWEEQPGVIGGIILFSEVITERKRTQHELQRQYALLKTQQETTLDGIVAIDPEGRIISYNRAYADAWRIPADVLEGGRYDDVAKRIVPLLADPEQVMARVDYFDAHPEESGQDEVALTDGRVLERYSAPMRGEDGVLLGRVWYFHDITKRKLDEKRIEMQLDRFSALRTIDLAIRSGGDLHVTLDVLLENVTGELGIDAAAILLLDSELGELSTAASRGLASKRIMQQRVKLGSGYAGQAALERHTIVVPDVRKGSASLNADLLDGDGFTTMAAVPLIAKGEVKGVLCVFNREAFGRTPEWIEFLEILAGHAAIAIDDAQLLDRLKRTNAELAVAYDSTIEGWSRAMDLRDKETEGHTERVTEFTIKMARAIGMSSEGILNARRGALLHDMGKLGVPDAILVKPGKLTDQEWAIMQMHPQYVYDMLAGIPYLRPALDIPYCHHEHWDGNGYPQGLRGEQIPLAARLFAVADVWDAIRSDRPYRPAWPEDRALEHIRSQSGTHFDPQAVEVFLHVLAEERQLEAE